MPAQTLRPYQREGVTKILAAVAEGARSILVVSPTGSGKTSVFSWLAAQMKTPVLINVHRRELATQASNRLREFGVQFGMIMAGERPNPTARVQIASVQTLVRRKTPRARLVINDEAHLSTAATWTKILEQYPEAIILGFTATPWRQSGKPLVGAYDRVIVLATPTELRKAGFLCPYVGFSYLTPDLDDVETNSMGEFDEAQSAAAMRQPQIVSNIVEMWQAHASHLSTVAFAVNVEHSRALCAEFIAAGVKAEHLDGQTPKLQRDAILDRVARGQTQVLCNVGIAVEGLDIPRLKCIIDACPTKSLGRCIQKWGRGRRPWQDVTCRIHDHAFNIKRHGLPDAERDYTLRAQEAKPESVKHCAKCHANYEGPKCPSCGIEAEVKPQGERKLATVNDAEQFTFTSDADCTPEQLAERYMPPPLKAPVVVKWDAPGKVVEGVLEQRWEVATAWGKQNRYLVRGPKRDYDMPGTADLDAKMLRVQIPDSIRVTFLREAALPGGKFKKFFSVEVDR